MDTYSTISSQESDIPSIKSSNLRICRKTHEIRKAAVSAKFGIRSVWPINGDTEKEMYFPSCFLNLCVFQGVGVFLQNKCSHRSTQISNLGRQFVLHEDVALYTKERKASYRVPLRRWGFTMQCMMAPVFVKIKLLTRAVSG